MVYTSTQNYNCYSMLSSILLLATVSADLVSAQANPNVAAIDPTKSGQIGVNPVSIYPPESYRVPHAHTQYWDQGESTTKVWFPAFHSYEVIVNATDAHISGSG